jgi:hypothetical protein
MMRVSMLEVAQMADGAAVQGTLHVCGTSDVFAQQNDLGFV